MSRLGLVPRSSIIKPLRVGDLSIEFGNIIQFKYNPVTDNLPYYDKNPLAFYLGGNTTDILGLNLHFIPEKYRRDILDIILQVKIKIGATASQVQEIIKNNPRVTTVQIDEALFGGVTNIQRSITGRKGVDWTAFTTLSGNPIVRVMKVGLRVYKVSNMGKLKKVEYISEDVGKLSKTQIKLNESILQGTSDIIGINSSDIANAAKIAIKNGPWYTYLANKSK